MKFNRNFKNDEGKKIKSEKMMKENHYTDKENTLKNNFAQPTEFW